MCLFIIRLSDIFLKRKCRMAFFFRRLRAGDEDSEDEEDMLLVDASDSNPSGKAKRTH